MEKINKTLAKLFRNRKSIRTMWKKVNQISAFRMEIYALSEPKHSEKNMKEWFEKQESLCFGIA